MFFNLTPFPSKHFIHLLIISVVGGYLREGVNIKPAAYVSISLGSLFSTSYFSNFKKYSLRVCFSSNLFILHWLHSGHKGKEVLERSREWLTGGKGGGGGRGEGDLWNALNNK